MQKWIRIAISFLLFLLLFVGYFHEVRAFTQDLGRHLLLGKIILGTGSIPTTNLLSYTYPDFPFLNHHYLSEVVFYLFFTVTNTLGLLLLTMFLVMLAFSIVFFFAQKRTSILALSIVSILLLRVLFERTDIRPEIFSFLFLSIFVTILYAYRERFTKWVYALPLLMLLWVNMHVYFFIGIIILTLFLIDGIIMHRTKPWCKYTSILVVILALSALATLINPHGLKGALYPLQAFQNYGYTIEENQTIFLLESLGFVKESVFYFKLAVILLFLSLLLSVKKSKPIDWLLAITFSLAGALAVRNLPLFTFAIFIPFAISLSHALKTLSALSTPSAKTLSFKNIAILLLGGLLLWQIVSVGKAHSFGFTVDPGAEKAADFFVKNNLQGPIFNNFDIGSYLVYRLYPREKVFVDGRPEAYPVAFFQKTYIPMQEKEHVFEEIDKHYGFNTIFFSHTDQTPWATAFLQTIVKNPNWKTVYLDDYVIILVKQNEENSTLLKQFGMDAKTLKPISAKNQRSLLRLASFFRKIGDREQEFRLYEAVLKIDPTNCIALFNAGVLAAEQNSPLAGIFGTRYQHACD